MTGIVSRLNEEALTERAFEETLTEFAQRLLDGGVPLARISVGRMMLHPVIGLFDTTWDGEMDRVASSLVGRTDVEDTLTAARDAFSKAEREIAAICGEAGDAMGQRDLRGYDQPLSLLAYRSGSENSPESRGRCRFWHQCNGPGELYGPHGPDLHPALRAG